MARELTERSIPRKGFSHIFHRRNHKDDYSIKSKISPENITNLMFLNDNHSTVITPSPSNVIKELLSRAKSLFENRAYLHWV